MADSQRLSNTFGFGSADYPSQLHAPKRAPSTSPTVCALLISETDDVVDTNSLRVYSTTIINFAMHELETTNCEEIVTRHWTSNSAVHQISKQAWTSDSSFDETLFSQYLRSPSPCSSVKEFSYHTEPLTAPTSMTSLVNHQEKPNVPKDRLRIRLRIHRVGTNL